MKYAICLFAALILLCGPVYAQSSSKSDPTNLNKPSGLTVQQKLQYMGFCLNDGRPAKLIINLKGLKADGEMTAEGIEGQPYPRTEIQFSGKLSDNWKRSTVRLTGRWKGGEYDVQTGEKRKGTKTKGNIHIWWEGNRIHLQRDDTGSPFIFDPSTERVLQDRERPAQNSSDTTN